MTDDERRDYQILHLASGPLLPLLEKRLELAKNLLLQAYSGNKDLLGPVARFAEAHEIIKDIKRKVDIYETLTEEKK